MKGEYKPFDKQTYAENNQKAIDAVLKYLPGSVENVKDKYGPDIIAMKGFRKSHYVEVEIKYNWKPHQDYFPFDTVQLPERKSKFTKLDLPIEFWILRPDLFMAVIIAGSLLKDDLLVEVPNRLVNKGELFHKIPVSECRIVDMRLGLKSGTYVSEGDK